MEQREVGVQPNRRRPDRGRGAGCRCARPWLGSISILDFFLALSFLLLVPVPGNLSAGRLYSAEAPWVFWLL